MVQLRVVDKVNTTGGRADLVNVLPRGLFIKDISVGVFDRNGRLCLFGHSTEESWVQIQNRLATLIV